MNPRQGNDPIAKVGIMRTVAVDPNFKASPITNKDLEVSIQTNQNSDFYSAEDLGKKLNMKSDFTFGKTFVPV